MSIILGVNHQFLYPESVTSETLHTETLKKLSLSYDVKALDCWSWRGARAKEEAKILKDSGKVINYNIGDRYGEDVILPASSLKSEQDRAYDILMREISYAIDANSKKIIFASGPDYPDNREKAKENLMELVLKIGLQLPSDIELALEPTDWDIDKHFLFGPLDETVDFVKAVHQNGFKKIGVLLDQCHIGIMHETPESAVYKTRDTLIHVHLGNCLLKDKENPFYGDKHIPWNYPGGEYDTKEAILFIKQLNDIGYFEKNSSTISFEMRPIDGYSPEDSLREWIKIFNMSL